MCWQAFDGFTLIYQAVPLMFPVHTYNFPSFQGNEASGHAMVITKGDIKISFPSNSNEVSLDEGSDEVSNCTSLINVNIK